MSRKKVGVIIAGCGYLDGAEIQETVAVMAALEKFNIEAEYMAPDMDQMHVVNHITCEVMEGEKRNVLIEAARIVRGNISALDSKRFDQLDGLVLAGGFGAAKNLSNYAVSGRDMEIHPEVEKTIQTVHVAGLPIAALCITPVVVGKILQDESPVMTLGEEGPDAENFIAMGGKHQVAGYEDIIVDEKLKLVSGPCYMLDSSVGKVMRGTENIIRRFKEFL